MRYRKHKLCLVRRTGKNPDLISTASPDEQARFLKLADIALHNVKPNGNIRPAGTRAKENHRRLERDLQDVLEKFERDKNEAA